MDISRIKARTSDGTPGRPVRHRLFHVQNRRKPRRCQASTVAGCTIWSAAVQPCHRCDSQDHSTRSTVVKRTRGRRERFATASWCRSARISRCSVARECSKNRSESSSETTTDTMSRAYSEPGATSMVTRRTPFLVGTGTSSLNSRGRYHASPRLKRQAKSAIHDRCIDRAGAGVTADPSVSSGAP